MFVWTAIDVESQLEDICLRAKEVEKKVAFTESNITLPLHVSLKISTPIPEGRFSEVMEDLTTIFKKETPFSLEPEKLELHETIAWIKVKENPRLVSLHERLCQLFLEKYQVPLHEYDKDFLFHITIFLDGDKDKVKEAFLSMLDCPIPSFLKANHFVIGGSPEGKLGTYQVFRNIPVVN